MKNTEGESRAKTRRDRQAPPWKEKVRVEDSCGKKNIQQGNPNTSNKE